MFKAEELLLGEEGRRELVELPVEELSTTGLCRTLSADDAVRRGLADSRAASGSAWEEGREFWLALFGVKKPSLLRDTLAL